MFDVISDIHAGSYMFRGQLGISAQELVKNLIPEEPQELLVIAGDIGNSNKTVKEILIEFCKYYEKILIVFGNHDLFCHNEEYEKAKKNPLYRWELLQKDLKSNDKIVFLNGDTYEYNGIVFGGTGGWYDLSYTMERFGKDIKEAEEIYVSGMMDSDYIPGMERFNWDFVQEQYKKLLDIHQKVDVMITHVPPTTDCMKEEFSTKYLSGCFYFNGEYLVENTTAKVWVFGHSHNLYDEVKYNTRLVNHSLGYPEESPKAYYPIKQIKL